MGKHINFDVRKTLSWEKHINFDVRKTMFHKKPLFNERLEDQNKDKKRTVYRLVCNFTPSGNQKNQSVYTKGISCSRCPNGTACDEVYNALCSKPVRKIEINTSNKTENIVKSQKSNESNNKSMWTGDWSGNTTTISDKDTDAESYTLFDYFSHLHEYTRYIITETSTTRPECKDMLAVDEFINLLKKKLSNDHMFKELLLASKTTQGFPDTNFTDARVAAFVNKIYSKKEPLTTIKSTASELLNSTLLVDLVEAVIFRSGDKTPVPALEERSTNFVYEVSPVKIQAELAQVQENEDFTGHYFFPEDEEAESTTETTEYEDVTNPSVADILLEIEDIKKKKVTKNFLDYILESESSESSVETTTIMYLSPDNMNAHKNGHDVMKKFLENIKEKS